MSLKTLKIKSAYCLQGEITLPGDKSICHRAVIASCLSKGRTVIKNFSFSKDCVVTVNAFRKMGVKIIEYKEDTVGGLIIYGRGLRGLKAPKQDLNMGESGTSFRLIAGVLAGQKFNSYLKASGSLSKRPMRRITQPLRLMGAEIKSRDDGRGTTDEGRRTRDEEEYSPFIIKGTELKAVRYKLPIPSAQVKSCILLAGLYAKGKTQIIEPIKSRDHTERMLRLFGAEIDIRRKSLKIKGGKDLVSPGEITIPGDISSAAFFIVGALILPHSYLVIKNVGLNPTRIGLLRVLKRMGANIQTSLACQSQKPGQADIRHQTSDIRHQTSTFEPVGDIIVKSSKLKGAKIKKEEIPSLIDELPILMVAACFAKGKTVFEGIGELRVKETDRINSMVTNLRRMGARIRLPWPASHKSQGRQTKKEKIIIEGGKQLRGTKLNSFGDHRSAMSLIIASLACKGESVLYNIECINKSFPGFKDILSQILI